MTAPSNRPPAHRRDPGHARRGLLATAPALALLAACGGQAPSPQGSTGPAPAPTAAEGGARPRLVPLAPAEPNLEAVASLAPDLILTSKIRHEALADRIKAIGPTVYGERTGVVWKQNFALYAQAMGREAQAEATVRAYEARVRALNAALPSPRPTISVVRVLNNHLRYYQRANYSGTVLNDLGFPRPPSQNVDDFGLLNQSLETLGPLGDADLIVVCPTEGEQGAFLREMRSSSIWQSLGAVKRGAVLPALDDVWMAGIGYRSAGVILDDLARYFKVNA
jgi:ABC-type Fe3+-hydroxamate transport system substrate-binding protein